MPCAEYTLKDQAPQWRCNNCGAAGWLAGAAPAKPAAPATPPPKTHENPGRLW